MSSPTEVYDPVAHGVPPGTSPAEQPTADAWLLDAGRGHTIAIGISELAHVVAASDVTVQRIAAAPRYCSQALVWNGAVLPVLDLVARCAPGAPLLQRAVMYALVHFDTHDGGGADSTTLSALGTSQVQLGALALASTPRRHTVREHDACAMASADDILVPVSIACFRGPAGGPVPVIDLSALFGFV